MLAEAGPGDNSDFNRLNALDDDAAPTFAALADAYFGSDVHGGFLAFTVLAH